MHRIFRSTSAAHHRLLRLASCLSAALLVSTLPATATDWPGLRGPGYDGAAHDAALFGGATEGEAELEIGWQRDIGSGYSAIVIGEGRVITMFADGAGTDAASDVMAAFDTASGEELWRYRIGDMYAGHDGSHDGPISTPALANGRVFGVAPRGEFFALDAATGKQLWKLHLVDDLEAKKPHYGFSSSPIAHGDQVVLQIGAGENQSIAAFSAVDGSKRWSLGSDEINYHSPVLAELGGVRQIVAAGPENIYGIDPATGEQLWTYAHEGDPSAMGGATIIPIPAGDDRLFLLNKVDSSVMLHVKSDGAEAVIEELWSNNTIRSSYSIPVVHDGYIYGISGRVLTAVDAATGERAWRSRAPGDGFPTLVGDHVVMMTKAGSLHVVEATPDAYIEVANLDLFDDQSWSSVAWADGHLYARSMGQLARIDPRRAAADPAADTMKRAAADDAPWLAATDFGAFLKRVKSTDAAGKAAVVDAFLAEQESFPIVEASGAVHFLYRGDDEDVGIVGDMIGFRREEPMARVPGTDLFYYSTRLEPTAGVSYGFLPSFGDEPVADPHNDAMAGGLFGDVSWLAMPAFEVPAYASIETSEPAADRLETLTWKSVVREDQERTATVYLPPGYGDGDQRYPVLYIHDGQSAMEQGKLIAALDQVAASMEPVIAVFVIPGGDNPRRDLGDSEGYAKMVATELVPLVDERFRTRADRLGRASAGVGSGANASMACVFGYPDLFARVGFVGPTFMTADEFAEQLPDTSEHSFVVYHQWGTYHLRSPHEAWDMVVSNRDLWQLLRDRGYAPAGGEVPVGFGWRAWQPSVTSMLNALFPSHG